MDQCIRWFQSYRCEWIFVTVIENQLSDYEKISCGVPQVSILGLLLFLIYVNDMPQVVKPKPIFPSWWLMFYVPIYRCQRNWKKTKHGCNWPVDNKLSIRFGEDKTKLNPFLNKPKIKRRLNIKYKELKIKQHSQVTCPGDFFKWNLVWGSYGKIKIIMGN